MTTPPSDRALAARWLGDHAHFTENLWTDTETLARAIVEWAEANAGFDEANSDYLPAPQARITAAYKRLAAAESRLLELAGPPQGRGILKEEAK